MSRVDGLSAQGRRDASLHTIAPFRAEVEAFQEMRDILIHRHPDCARCARIARTHHAFDLFRNVADTTESPPTGALRMGEIVVQDRASGRIAQGAEAFLLITRAIPLYAPARLLLKLRTFRSYIEREMGGCDDGACAVRPSKQAS